MGASSFTAATSQVYWVDVKIAVGADITIGTDYHEVVTFLALGAITGGEVRIVMVQPA